MLIVLLSQIFHLSFENATEHSNANAPARYHGVPNILIHSIAHFQIFGSGDGLGAWCAHKRSQSPTPNPTGNQQEGVKSNLAEYKAV